jgi:hypothetical protein
MKVSDYEIILNAGATIPYPGGARVSVDRGDTNFQPFLSWNETSLHWELYDGTNTGRVIDSVYGDSIYANINGDTFTGTILSTVDVPFVSKMEGYKSWAISHPSYNNLIFTPSTLVDGTIWDASKQITFTDSGSIITSGYLTVGTNATITGTLTLSGNKLAFGNSSLISNENDTQLDIKGDGKVYIYSDSITSNYAMINASAFGVGVLSDAEPRTIIQMADGKIGFGPGTAASDTWLYRDTSNSLRTDGAINVAGKLTTSYIQIGNSTTTGYYLTAADTNGNASWTALPADKYLSEISGTCNSNVTFTVANGTNITWNSAHTHINDHSPSSDNQNVFTSVTVNKANAIAVNTGEGVINVDNLSTDLGFIAGTNVTLNHDITNKIIKITATAYDGVNGVKLNGTSFSIDALTSAECLSQTNAAEIVVLSGGIYTKLGTTSTTAASGDHNHSNLIAGNGITGNTYDGKTQCTWSISSNTGTDSSVGTIVVGTDSIGVSLGNTGVTACAGNDPRLSDDRTPVIHDDSLHNCYAYARISFDVGKTKAIWTHNKNWNNYIIQITPNSPETHFYYTDRTSNSITIGLDDPAYEPLDVDVVLI